MDGFIAKLSFALFFFRASTQGVIFFGLQKLLQFQHGIFPGILKQFQEVRDYTERTSQNIYKFGIHYSHSVFHVLHPLVPFQALYYSTQMTVLDKDPPAMQKKLFQDNSVPIWGVRSAARTASNGWHKACSTNSTARMHRFWVWLVVFILSLSTILCIVAMPLSLMAVGSIHLLTGIQNRRAANLSSKRLHQMNLP